IGQKSDRIPESRFDLGQLLSKTWWQSGTNFSTNIPLHHSYLRAKLYTPIIANAKSMQRRRFACRWRRVFRENRTARSLTHIQVQVSTGFDREARQAFARFQNRKALKMELEW